MSTYADDIPATLAQSAYAGVSFSPAKRGEQSREDYAATLAADYADLLALAEREQTTSLLVDEFARYRAGYAKRYRAYLASNARCISWMITGPANFPTARNEKRNNIAHKRLTEFLEFRERALKAMRRTLCPSAAPIMAGDADAVERLAAKLAEAEQDHANMKLVNAAHKAFLKDPASLDTSALPDKWRAVVRAYKPVYSWEPHPIAPYQLTNSNANIRRMRERLEALQAAKQAPAGEVQGTLARVEDVPAENRVRLFFPGKPDDATRARLKAGGFRWSPTLGCWQAYRHQHTRVMALREAGFGKQEVPL